MYCATHKYIETDMFCSTCFQAICGKCLKKKNEKDLCTLCYVKTITQKTANASRERTLKKNDTKKNPYSTKSFEINPDRLQSMVQVARLKQENARKKRNRNLKTPEEPVKALEVKIYCNWHQRIIAEYNCSKCNKDFCRECLGQRRQKETYCKNCWNTIRFANILPGRKFI